MIETKGGFLISQIKRIQGRVFGRLLTEAGIDEFNGAQGHILYVLWQEDNLPIVELARRTGLAKATLTVCLIAWKGWGILQDVMIPKIVGKSAFALRIMRTGWKVNTKKFPMK